VNDPIVVLMIALNLAGRRLGWLLYGAIPLGFYIFSVDYTTI